MKIIKAEYSGSAVSPKQYPLLGQPEIVLLGRSNVGKSSLINRCVNRKNLAHTSSQPGKTQALNFYHINDSWFFVDLPGYGYARVSKTVQSSWAGFINSYLNTREQIAGIIMVVDIRHDPSPHDAMMYEWIRQSCLPHIIVAAKADKVSRGRWEAHRKKVADGLNPVPGAMILAFSALTGEGLEPLLRWLEGCIAAFGERGSRKPKMCDKKETE